MWASPISQWPSLINQPGGVICWRHFQPIKIVVFWRPLLKRRLRPWPSLRSFCLLQASFGHFQCLNCIISLYFSTNFRKVTFLKQCASRFVLTLNQVGQQWDLSTCLAKSLFATFRSRPVFVFLFLKVTYSKKGVKVGFMESNKSCSKNASILF